MINQTLGIARDWGQVTKVTKKTLRDICIAGRLDHIGRG
jgi:hypothetical protein